METRESVIVVWREVLTGSFSTLGRMARLAGCYNPQTDCYFHGKVAVQLGFQETGRALRKAHELVWADWLRGSLDQQKADVHCHLNDLSDGPLNITQAVAVWRESRPFLGFIPASVEAAERNLFLSNLGIILDLLHNQYGSEPTISIDASTSAHSGAHEQLIETIREQYRDPDLSLKRLSAKVHLSERHLGRVFANLAGQTFRQYLRNLRITEAAKLLRDDKATPFL